MLITVSNLFPRPDQPNRGLYNFYLFREMAKAIGRQDSRGRTQNICLVPEWRLWRWRTIRCWAAPDQTASPTRYIPVPYLPWVGRSFNDRFYDWALKGWAQTVSPGDMVYVPWLFPDGVAVARAIRNQGARLWLMALGTDTFHLKSPLRRMTILKACDQAEGIVCVAQVLADRLAAAGVPRFKLHVVTNGVDTSLFRGRDEAEFLTCPGVVLSGERSMISMCSPQHRGLQITQRPDYSKTAHRVVLFVGNLVPVKGPDVLLRAFASLDENRSCGQVAGELGECSAYPSTAFRRTKDSSSASSQWPDHSTTKLLIIGSGPMQAQLERMAKNLGISERVHFLGRQSREEVALWMNRADVLCLSSWSEGMPNVVLEARASGLPVVTTPAGAIPELPLAQEHFLVVKSCSPKDLAEGLREMLSRDLSQRKPDPAVPTWAQQAEKVRELIWGQGRQA